MGKCVAKRLQTWNKDLANASLRLAVLLITPHCPYAHDGGHRGEDGELGCQSV